MFSIQSGIVGEARIVERAFGVGPCVLSEAMAWLQDHLASADAFAAPPDSARPPRVVEFAAEPRE